MQIPMPSLALHGPLGGRVGALVVVQSSSIRSILTCRRVTSHSVEALPKHRLTRRFYICDMLITPRHRSIDEADGGAIEVVSAVEFMLEIDKLFR
jgi:hypothetical protein